MLILWLDCDREGENIAFEVIDLVKKLKPKVILKRAKFSSLTKHDILNAMKNLELPNKNLSDGVDIRMSIDLIIGSSFTQLQTLLLRKLFFPNWGSKEVISYGPCQFPTLGFVVKRGEEIKDFVSEEFHYLQLEASSHEIIFNWKRNRLFDKEFVTQIYEKFNEALHAVVTEV